MFSERLKELRKARGLTQEQLAAILSWFTNRGLQLPKLVQTMIGSNSNIAQGQTAVNIADYFDVSIDYLLGREDTKKTIPMDWEWKLTPEQATALDIKDRLDIGKRIQELRDDLANSGELYLSGEVMDEETRELLMAAMENAAIVGKIVSKQRKNK